MPDGGCAHKCVLVTKLGAEDALATTTQNAKNDKLQRTELIRATLATLHAFLSWIPLGYIFESPLLETLLKFFPLPSYRNLSLQCLTEVAALNFGDFYNSQYVKMVSFQPVRTYLKLMHKGLARNRHLLRIWRCFSRPSARQV
ncbi:hypothetical protein POM88_020515 [Heracleum sosnowskyi]|uniref:Exportin-1/Importin-beta-like domain-containing protein n=1 Tax=Heracleum sosnowskyi TaxID=360622 RepID=A0AAD8IF87_9APIA|nr:hypothetical protein POM88_020515 [Heracleum sosnowskyi]